MKFDLIDAISIVKRRFGTAGEITISSLDHATVVTVSIVHSGQLLRNRFVISPEEANSDDHVSAVNFRFNRAIRELQIAVENNQKPEEHNAL